MAKDFILTNAVAQALANAITTAADAGTGAVFNIYSAGSGVPADADVAIDDQTLLAQLAMSSTSFGAATDGTGKATIAANSISDDESANATGTAAFFRVLTQDGGTVICQGTAGTSDADLVMDTTSITAGSTVSVSSFTIDVPEQGS
ncbi:MAG: hypothetical protein M0R75_16970 [Dehalococcoidia bacterium]|nr:hypothetical protein [Dehalococcoidia bacterium]